MTDIRSLLEAPSPAVLTTYRKDGSALVTPVWFRHVEGVFEVVIAEGAGRSRPILARARARVRLNTETVLFEGCGFPRLSLAGSRFCVIS